MITPSSNVIYNQDGRPVSFRDLESTYNEGGSRSFLLDEDLVGFLGTNNTGGKAIGNMLQGVGKSLWFVGNGVTNGVKAFNLSTLINIGGTSQVETVTVTAGCSLAGTIELSLVAGYVDGSPVTILIPLLISDNTTSEVAQKILTALRADEDITSQYYISISGSSIIFTDKFVRGNDPNLALTLIDDDGTGVTLGASTNTTAGSVNTSADLSSTPQFAKWNGTGWDNPVQVGILEPDTISSLQLTTTTTRSIAQGFTGTVVGSRTVRVARKRYGSIGIASAPSNLVTASEQGDSMVVSIPSCPDDGSQKKDNVWLIYVTYKGQGSTATHKLFPIEITEAQLDGSETPTVQIDGNAKSFVISQDPSAPHLRLVEIEFLDNDLLLLEPFDDYFSLEPCRFLAKLGNVMCGIGTGDDNTGFDVSYPNQHEAYPPDWRDWFSEVPVGISQETDLGFFWVCTANNSYLASWTGVTTGSAPVVIEKRSSMYGAIGMGAMCSMGGVLYLLTRGKTPVRISPDGQIDIEFGKRVRNTFANFTENTQISVDEATNSVVFIDGTEAIAFQVNNNVWTSPLTLTTDGGADVDSAYCINGNLYVCAFDGGNYTSAKWNESNSIHNWNATSSFQTGQYGLALKDIIELRAVISTEDNSESLTFLAYKNFLASSPVTLTTESISTAGNLINVRKYPESNDYDCVSARVSGIKGGTTIHALFYGIEAHSIERTV